LAVSAENANAVNLGTDAMGGVAEAIAPAPAADPAGTMLCGDE